MQVSMYLRSTILVRSCHVLQFPSKTALSFEVTLVVGCPNFREPPWVSVRDSQWRKQRVLEEIDSFAVTRFNSFMRILRTFQYDLRTYIPRLKTCSQELNIGSCHRCRTFRQFTPMLSEFRQSAKRTRVCYIPRNAHINAPCQSLSRKISHRNSVMSLNNVQWYTLMVFLLGYLSRTFENRLLQNQTERYWVKSLYFLFRSSQFNSLLKFVHIATNI